MVAAPRVGLLVQQLSAGAYAAARAAVGGAGQGQLDQLAEEVEDWAGLDQTSWRKNSARVCSQRVDKGRARRDAQEKPVFFAPRLIDTCCETCRFARAEHSLRRANSNFEPLAVFWLLGAKCIGQPANQLIRADRIVKTTNYTALRTQAG